MEKLKQKLADFSKITKLKMRYELQNGFVLEFQFKKSNFVHMSGLHKLKDIPLIQTFSSKPGFASQIISKIKKGTFTEADVFSSKYFPFIQKRYENFTLENLFSLVYTDIVVDFDISKLAKSKLVNTKFILFEKDAQNGNRHLCIAMDSLGKYYPETFFYFSKRTVNSYQMTVNSYQMTVNRNQITANRTVNCQLIMENSPKR